MSPIGVFLANIGIFGVGDVGERLFPRLIGFVEVDQIAPPGCKFRLLGPPSLFPQTTSIQEGVGGGRGVRCQVFRALSLVVFYQLHFFYPNWQQIFIFIGFALSLFPCFLGRILFLFTSFSLRKLEQQKKMGGGGLGKGDRRKNTFTCVE